MIAIVHELTDGGEQINEHVFATDDRSRKVELFVSAFGLCGSAELRLGVRTDSATVRRDHLQGDGSHRPRETVRGNVNGEGCGNGCSSRQGQTPVP